MHYNILHVMAFDPKYHHVIQYVVMQNFLSYLCFDVFVDNLKKRKM